MRTANGWDQTRTSAARPDSPVTGAPSVSAVPRATRASVAPGAISVLVVIQVLRVSADLPVLQVRPERPVVRTPPRVFGCKTQAAPCVHFRRFWFAAATAGCCCPHRPPTSDASVFDPSGCPGWAGIQSEIGQDTQAPRRAVGQRMPHGPLLANGVRGRARSRSAASAAHPAERLLSTRREMGDEGGEG